LYVVVNGKMLFWSCIDIVLLKAQLMMVLVCSMNYQVYHCTVSMTLHIAFTVLCST